MAIFGSSPRPLRGIAVSGSSQFTQTGFAVAGSSLSSQIGIAVSSDGPIPQPGLGVHGNRQRPQDDRSVRPGAAQSSTSLVPITHGGHAPRGGTPITVDQERAMIRAMVQAVKEGAPNEPEDISLTRDHLAISMLSPDTGLSSREERDQYAEPEVLFSKELLMHMAKDKTKLGIDIFTLPTSPIFPLNSLAPLCAFRHLQQLVIVGMQRSYQCYIWLVVWLNPQLKELYLAMETPGERLDTEMIRSTQREALTKPMMHQVAAERTTALVSQRMRIITLTLEKYAVDDTAPFEYFDQTTLRRIRFHECDFEDFSLPQWMRNVVEVE